MIASGGHTAQTEWTQTLMEQVPETWSMRMNAISHHYYTLPTGDWDVHGRALAFGEDEWFSTLDNTLRIEDFIKTNIAIMDKHDPEKKWGFMSTNGALGTMLNPAITPVFYINKIHCVMPYWQA
jgi:Alpha-L-arabinofuranosidase